MLRKNDICVTKFDYDRLTDLLKKYNSAANRSKDLTSIKRLTNELKRAKKVDSKRISPDYVTMNSVFELKDIGNPGKFQFRLVFPDEADIEKGKLSILAPVGTAVLGYRVGDVIKWDVPAGEKYYQIDKIIYQPEANGDYHL